MIKLFVFFSRKKKYITGDPKLAKARFFKGQEFIENITTENSKVEEICE